MLSRRLPLKTFCGTGVGYVIESSDVQCAHAFDVWEDKCKPRCAESSVEERGAARALPRRAPRERAVSTRAEEARGLDACGDVMI